MGKKECAAKVPMVRLSGDVHIKKSIVDTAIMALADSFINEALSNSNDENFGNNLLKLLLEDDCIDNCFLNCICSLLDSENHDMKEWSDTIRGQFEL